MYAMKLLNALLRYHETNFRILHWNSCGDEFEEAHVNISNTYYEMCYMYADQTAEMLARLDEFVLSYEEAAAVANECKWTCVDCEQLYTKDDVIEYSQELLEEIVSCIVECFDDTEISSTENAGIRSDLESMLENFDLQYRYINKRRNNK